MVWNVFMNGPLVYLLSGPGPMFFFLKKKKDIFIDRLTIIFFFLVEKAENIF